MATAKDPVCGMDVNPDEAAARGLTSQYKGDTFYFCSLDCKDKFDKSRDLFVGSEAEEQESAGSMR